MPTTMTNTAARGALAELLQMKVEEGQREAEAAAIPAPNWELMSRMEHGLRAAKLAKGGK